VSWHDACDAALPDGSVVEAVAGATFVALARANGAWHAVELWCTHAECPLSDGWVEGAALRCACHGALFDLATGEPLEGPAETRVRVFPARIRDGRVEVDVSSDSAP
jgi:3-phenylpropionate/trans-cinnamate dioxygenase ferredoxin component